MKTKATEDNEDLAAWASLEAERLLAYIDDNPRLHSVQRQELTAALLAAERRGRKQAATWIEEPYPEDVFPPLSKEEMQYVMSALQLGWPARLHASWARHWAKVIREKGNQ